MGYDKLPTRGKETSCGEKIESHKAKSHGMTCGGRVYVSYEENMWYAFHCENCGEIVRLKTKSLDMSIELWNKLATGLVWKTNHNKTNVWKGGEA